MLRPVQIFGIGDHVILGDRHDLPSGELLLAFALRGGASSKDCGDGVVGICWHIDKFSKWIEYKPLVQSTTKKAAELFNNMIHRFGLPNSIITDLGSTFTDSDFWDFYEDRCISIKYVSVAHPRANG